jgi:hypothetical protein
MAENLFSTKKATPTAPPLVALFAGEGWKVKQIRYFLSG